MKNPSALKDKFPFCSVFQNTETEIVADNIMKILARTGDAWRELTWEEYQVERKKDKGFSSMEKRYFETVLKYTVSYEQALRFSEEWV